MTTLKLSTAIDEVEARMRRALDIGGAREARGRQEQHGGPRQPRQFAQDGDVPVVRLPGRKDPGLAASMRLEEQLQAERQQREQVEAALRQAQTSLQAMETRFAHAELARIDAEARARKSAEQVKLAEDRAAEAEAALVARPAASAEPAAPALPRRRQRTADAAAEEADGQEPVQWWVPGWRDGLARGKA